MKKSIVLLLSIFAVLSHSYADDPPNQLLKEVCLKQNLFELKNKNTLSFTFNVKLPSKTVTRNWVWNIKSDEIKLNRVNQNEFKKFTNDIYWLIFPLKAFYDSNQTRVNMNKNVESPISKSMSTELIITYTGGKGYTPNDVYKLYINKNAEIIEWSYLKGGKMPPARTTSWKNYQTFDGIKISLLRESSGEFKVWFTDVSIK